MKQLEFKQFLPVTLEEAWDFFSSPKNLEVITPGSVNFKIISELPEKIYPGLIITYQIKVLPASRFKWITEITEVRHLEFFVDEQRIGPYRRWRHEHYFTKMNDGVLMTDKLYYDIGKSIFGWIAGKLFVHQKVKEIFAFRYNKLEGLFVKKL